MTKHSLAAALSGHCQTAGRAFSEVPIDFDPSILLEQVVNVGRQLRGDETTVTHCDTGTFSS
jgi:hypothetical protein